MCGVFEICGKVNFVLKLKYNNQKSMEFQRNFTRKHYNAINGITSDICVVYLTFLSF